MILSPIQRAEFLRQSGWGGAYEVPVGEDWSQRKIFRVERNGKTAIVMHAVPDDDPRATPGHHLRDYVTISQYLRSMQLSTPEVYAADLRHGLLLVEDFGKDNFADLLGTPAHIDEDFYILSTRTLIHLYKRTASPVIELPAYEEGHVHQGRRRVVDWYMPAVLGRMNPDGLAEEFLEVMSGIEQGLPPVRRRFLHGDFHPGNLMWLPQRVGIEQVGLLDFQGAYMGPAPYDLVNLLDDARRTVPENLRQECLQRFIQELGSDEAQSFKSWYTVLAVQFHCRVIGQAIKLAIRDNKTRLMDLMPILQHHLVKDLSDPVLEPLKTWFQKQGINFNQKQMISLAKARPLIRPDAF